MRRNRTARSTALVCAALLALLGCSSADDGDAGDTVDLDESAVPAQASTEAGPDVPADAGDTGDDVGSVVPAVTYEVFLSRDPFEPVVPEEIEAAAEADDDPDADDDTDPDDDPNHPSDPADPNDPDDPDDPDPSDPDDTDDTDDPDDPCIGRNEVVCDGQVVSLIDVTTNTAGDAIAVIQVDTTLYEVRVGQSFAEYYQLRAIDGVCVSLLYGDDGFQLCTGDTVLK